MNNTFDINRFTKLFAKHTAEHYKSYLMSILVLAGLICVLYIFSLLNGGGLHPKFRFSMATFFYILAGSIFTSSIFANFTQKNKAIDALILPASHFEKFLVGWLYSYIIYTLVFSVTFGLVDLCFTRIWPSEIQRPYFLEAIPENGLSIQFMVYTVLHSFALFGAIFFDRLHFVKTTLCFFAVVCVLSIFHFMFLKMLFPDIRVIFNSPIMAAALTFNTGSSFTQLIQIEQSEMRLYLGVLVTGLTLAFWASSYFQIKEKQI
jgi:hypothetical protein